MGISPVPDSVGVAVAALPVAVLAEVAADEGSVVTVAEDCEAKLLFCVA